MADRNVTFEQFVKMSHEERGESYQYLSDVDKLRVRICMQSSGSQRIVPCNVCAHREKKTPNCKAFPNGIAGQHIRDLRENPSKECGNGYYFIPEEEV